MQDFDIVVVGGGHNGLVAANYLADAGYQVAVCESNPAVGGMTATSTAIDAAPQHLINSFSVDAFFWDSFPASADLNLDQYGLRRNEIDPGHLYLHPEGGSIGFWCDPTRTADDIRRFSPADARAYLEFAEMLGCFSDIMLRLARTNPVRPDPSAIGYAARRALSRRRQVSDLLHLPISSVSEIIAERFSHQVVRDALHASSGSTVPNDMSGTGVAFLWLATMHRFTCKRPVGGVQAIPDALARRLQAKQGTVVTNSPVAEIVVNGRRAAGLRLVDGTRIGARKAVVASCDPRTALGTLVPSQVLPAQTISAVENIPVTNLNYGQAKVDLALNGTVTMKRHQDWRRDDLDVRRPSHMIGTEAGMRRLFAKSAAGLLPNAEELSLWPVIPTALDPTQAPPGQDTVYLYCAVVPYAPDGGWDSAKDKFAETVLDAAALYYGGLRDLEIGRQVLTNDDIAKRTHACGGNVAHVDMVLSRSGPLRPARGLGGYTTPVEGLYLGSSGSHPGGGITGGPGYLAARKVIKDLRPRRLVRRPPWSNLF
ncbi:NAD(P)/FAD-dependent oxidoreductase [Mycobacterium sp. CVI_P3]|uniref:Pyridine nucleotide-disulfide oxidoreductase domain-containing protein 2 n=1 Tax=Mycobacterium pinniadriaticum TaxID=2994102 RepID=A0ABT3SA42_9MYCO|nr:NAD(P)/FAD-dependent oxidoreductase [Mycobacterium pinniadriaticum]MCX2929975.1 NAD(P)/FAD-dependent oxidoreductase [Mycobacterium pinniadriaticum]MCX2936376.1 NAD(P)/FAD-dependent oxidoreductase [Mycobacterium pinniadriaticum]